MEKYSKLNIAIVDDDSIFLKIFKNLIKQVNEWQIELWTCSDWADLHFIIKKEKIDLIFLDYYIQNSTALDFVAKVKEMGLLIPIIIISSKKNRELIFQTAKAGVSDYLIKEELTNTIIYFSIKHALSEYHLMLEKKLLTEELNQSNKLSSIGILTSGIAHDFNNILHGIQSNVDLIRIKNEDNEDISEELKDVELSIGEMAEIVHQLLNFGKKTINTQEIIDVKQVISEAMVILKHTIPKRINIKNEFLSDNIFIKASRGVFYQIILNLCINASESIENNGEIIISCRKDLKDLCVVEVKDTGKGMDSETIEHIFEPFYTTKGFATEKGRGLGLAVVWNNINALNGNIRVKSDLGKGTTFELYFQSVAPPKHVTTKNNPIVTDTYKRILIVDDEKLFLKSAASYLKKKGFDILTADSGQKALYLYGKNKVDLVILDISMPQMDGIECFEHLLKLDPAVKVIFSSGHNILGENEKLKLMGAKNIIQKPYKLSELIKKINKTLN